MVNPCPHCGPTCYGGAAHNARREDGVMHSDTKPLYEVTPDGMWFWAIVNGRKVGRSTCADTALKIAREVATKGYTEMESNV